MTRVEPVDLDREVLDADLGRVHGAWHVVRTDDKRRGRLNLITHLLTQVPYTPLTPKPVTFPERHDPGDYSEPDLTSRLVPTPYGTYDPSDDHRT